MSAAYHANGDRIDQAIDTLYYGVYTNCTFATRAFNIMPITLQKWWNRGGS